MAYGPHLFENGNYRPVRPEPLERLRLVFQKLGKLVGFLVWRGQRQKRDRTSSCLVRGHGRLQLNAPPLGNLGRTDWTSPDTAAGLQASIGRRSMFVVFPHLNVRIKSSDSQALGRAALRQY
jgi:hypothetical protein